MGYLQGKRCYLSGPIEHDTSKTNWRISPIKYLREELGIDLFDPFSDEKQEWVPSLIKARDTEDYDTMAKIAKSFVRKDLSMVDRADFIIAYLPRNVVTTGTHHEIFVSNNAKKPTLLVCPEGKKWLPYWYFGYIPHKTAMFSSWASLYAYLEEVNAGLHKDNDRWAFVYGLV